MGSPSGVVFRCLDSMQTRPASFFRLLTISLGLMAVGAHAAAPIARPAIAIVGMDSGDPLILLNHSRARERC